MSAPRWIEVEALYQLALRRAPEERAAFLDSVCAGDPELRAHVEALLDEATRTLGEDTGTQAVAPASGAVLPGPGAQLGPYRILTALGAGGMGQVFRGEDTRLARPVAIKVLLNAGGSAGQLESRFAEEARAASALNHPNIVTIYDVGIAGGSPYIVMELVEGQTLKDVLAAGPLPIPRALALGAQIADALASAHARGIVHRDLKPANIMVTPEDRVKLLDFGLAKRLGAGGAQEGLTRPGTVLGTCGYMSPEQARGENTGFHTDQFSLGAVLYEMATGRRAFRGATEADTLAAVIRDRPEPLSKYNREIPAPFEWAVERCLAKRAEDRYPSTRRLAEELAALAAQAGQRSAAPPPAEAHNLPPQRTALIGRDKELEDLRQLLLLPRVRLVTLTGPGGIGKTRLVVEAARQMPGQFPGGVFYVSLEHVSSADLVAGELAGVLQLRKKDERSAEDAVRDHLRESCTSPTLLVLDNFEHVLAAAPLLRGLLDAAAALKIVVTSRAALRLYGEYEYAVPPLEIGAGAGSPAVALFLERAGGLRGAELGEDQLRLVAEICARLDGLPLAIELAAARTKVLPLSALRERLSDPLHLLAGGARDLPQRQQALRATLDWSYNLLDREHQKVFRRMAVFVGGATHEAIEAVCNAGEDLRVDFLDAIGALVDNSLLRRSGEDSGEPRFTLLETMREYGLWKLREAGEEAWVRKAHAAYCLVLAEDSKGEIEAANPYWVARLEAEFGNFRAALEWLASSGEADWGLRLITALHGLFFYRGARVEGARLGAKLLALPGAAARTQARAEALVCVGESADHGNPFLPEALEIFRELGMKTGMLRAMNSLAFTELRYGSKDAALRLGQQMIEIAREIGSASALAGTLSNLADMLRAHGEVQRAGECYEESRRLFESAGDQASAAWTLSHQGDLLRDLGRKDEAGLIYQQVLARFRALGHGPGTASSQSDLAALALEDGDAEGAEQRYREALHVYRGLGFKPDIARTLEGLAACAAARGQAGRALLLAGHAAQIRQAIHDPPRGAAKAKLEKCLESARGQLPGPAAAEYWMRGFHLPAGEAYALATGEPA
jgi:predicted ATPase/serine/threonine protein kinase